MKVYRLALIFLSSVIYGSVSAQSFEDLDNFKGDNAFLENNIEVFIRRTQVHAPKTLNYGGTTFNFRYRADAYEKGDWRWHFENPTLGDMLWVLAKQLKGKDPLAGDAEQAFGSGFFGWHEIGWNVVAKDGMLVSPGIAFGDHIFSSKRPSSAGGAVLQPSGYYFFFGPSVMFTKVLGGFWLNTTGRYDICGRTPKQELGYKNPRFISLTGTLHHAKTRLFGEVKFTSVMDRGANDVKAQRMDISFGYMF